MDEQLLPEHWLNLVSSSFYNTDVQDALDLENRYEDWRLVSMRVTPAAHWAFIWIKILMTCWPHAVGWQPVLEDFQLLWGSYTDFYADDRAIHAIYPVHLAMRMVAADPPTHGMLFKAGWLKEVHHLAFPVTYWTSSECLATPPHCGCSIDSTI